MVNKRKEICLKCENIKKVLGINTCSKCGCIINIKVEILNTNCPEGKW
jgi:hypothetical protein